ncbi:MAG: hypothetical protein BGO49_12265 [Planctomycetales bacterium 71-10]|nr:MAG: hypothetical protein BGO49_12265 [Planctomycetales bacterium 71-10]
MNETSTQSRAEPRSRPDRAHDGRRTPASPERAGSVRPGPGKVWGLVGLVALTAVTSLVVATISTWLVPAYMAAMALIFAAPRPPRPAGGPSTPEGSSAAPPEDAAPPRADDVEGTPVEGPEAADDPPAPAEAVAPAPAKPRKRRAKAKRGKAAQAAEATSEPTWIRVGPGKFVRADVQDAPADADATADPPSDPEAGAPTEAEPATLTAADLRIEAEATPSADVEPDAPAEAVDLPTHEDATPASPFEAEPSEVISPASFSDDEAEPMESGEEYGIAPSALAGAFDEGYGIAPSALVETWTPEALPEDVADDEPEPDAEPTDAGWSAEDETRSEARAEFVDEVEDEAPADAPEADPESPAATPATVAPPSPERLAPGGTATGPRGAARPNGLGIARRASRPRERLDRPRTPRHRGAVARPARSGRADRVRVRVAERGRRRSDPTGRRHHPRSPPGRA